MNPVGYVVDYTREQHERPSRLYVGAGHLEQQIRAWTVAHLGRRADIAVAMDPDTSTGVVLVDGCRVARVAVRPHVYPSCLGLDFSAPEHWDDDVMQPCVCCGTPTHGRVGKTALHGSCATDLLTEQVGRRYEQVVDELLVERFAAPTRAAGGAR